MEYNLSGQRAKSPKKALMAGLPNFWSSRTKMAPSNFWPTTKKLPKLASWSNYAKRTTIAVLTNKKKC
jgi:hypothetical protein